MRLVEVKTPDPLDVELKEDTSPEPQKELTVKIQAKEGLELAPVTELPSHFLPYETREIYVRGLTIDELKLLSKLEGNFSYKALLALLDEWKVIQGINIYSLIPVDFKLLLFLISHYTDPKFELSVHVNCPYCGTPIQKAITLADVEWGELKAKKIEFRVGEEVFNFRCLTMGDLVTLEEYHREGVDKPLSALALALLQGDEEDIFLKLEEPLKKLGGLPARLSRDLAQVERGVLPDVEPFEFQCHGCTGTFQAVPVFEPLDLFDTESTT